MYHIIAWIGLAFAGLFIGYAVAITSALVTIVLLQVSGKPVPRFLQGLAKSMVQ